MFKFVMTKNSNEIFHRAIFHNDIARTRLILEEAMKDPRFNIDEINDEGLTALQFSCFAGNTEMIEILINYGSNWKIRDRVGYTLLHASSMAGHPSVVRYLLQLGFKPVIKSDDGLMPIDVTDKLSVIVILLRSMLDLGHLKEMQDYMLHHPKLKRNIFQELEKVKCIEKERNEILGDLPYTSHPTSHRKTRSRVEKFNDNIGKRGRSLNTFSALSNSMQNLDTLYGTEINNNERTECYESKESSKTNKEKTRRKVSNSSYSSQGSKSSNNSCSIGNNGILRNDVDLETHRSTQKYLENRFPMQIKTVTFDLDYPNDYKSFSDGYISDSYDNKAAKRLSVSTLSTQSSNFSDAFSDIVSYDGGRDQTKSDLSTINENIYENLPLKSHPPPLPPRVPSKISSCYDDYSSTNNTDRQLGSETDSGIDINETIGRVFALSLDDKKLDEIPEVYVPKNAEDTYTNPVGLYSNDTNNAMIIRNHKNNDSDLPCGFFVRPNKGRNPKYQSWNGKCLPPQQNEDFDPYSSRRRPASMSFSDTCDEKLKNVNFGKLESLNFENSKNNPIRRSLADFNLDHQPDIML